MSRIKLILTIAFFTILAGLWANPYVVNRFQDQHGNTIEEVVVPGIPEALRKPGPVAFPTRSAVILGDVPKMNWSYGCSATSAAMIAGYYDINGYPNMYAGPTNDGVFPGTNASWGYGECPLSATHQGYDGLSSQGHVDRFWVGSGNSGNDPFGSGDPTLTYANCTADYMGTNQDWWNNSDGSTTFFYNTSGERIYDYSSAENSIPRKRDGTRGFRLFMESRGYEVSTNYNQYIYGHNGNTRGYRLAQFQESIDNGIPVMIHIEGHTMVGVGYESTNSTIYIHDTWNHELHSMTWGESYSGSAHYAVSVIELAYVSLSSIMCNPTSFIQSLSPSTTATQSLTISNTGIETLNYHCSVPSSEKTVLQENFATSTIPTNWTQELVSGSGELWSMASGGHNGYPALAQEGPYNARLYNPSTTPTVVKLISSPVNLSKASSATISFYHAQAARSGNLDELRVYYKNSPGGAWNLLVSYTGSFSSWTRRILALRELSSTYYIAFEGTAKNGYGVCLDSIEFTQKTSEVPWLTINSANSFSGSIPSGGASHNLSIGFDADGLEQGTYHKTITIASNSNTYSLLEIPVSLIVLPDEVMASDFIIGTGTNTQNKVPVYGYANFGWSKFIYKNDEMTAAGFTTAQSIEKIAFYVDNDQANYVMDNQKIYMGAFYDDEYPSGSYQNPVYHTLVYSGPVSWNGPGWAEIILDTPYSWNPTTAWNLEILWENRDGSRIAGPPTFRTTNTDFYSSVYKSGSSFPTSSGSRSKSYRPNIWFITPATAAPNPAAALAPVHAATDVDINTNLRWHHTGGSPSGYRLWLGTDNPPTNVVNNLLTEDTSYTPVQFLDYGTIYFWKAVPYNDFGPAADAETWSFTTLADPAISEFPYLEDFDGAFPPEGWVHYRGDLQNDPIELTQENNSYWEQKDWLNIPSQDKAASINIRWSMSGFMISPLFNIPSDDYVLEFDAAVLRSNQTPDGTPPNYANTDDQFAILIGDGFSWSLADIVREYNNSGSAYVLHDIPTTGERISIPLTGYTGHKRIAIFAGSLLSNDDNDVMFNDFRIGKPADIYQGVATPIGDAGDSVTITGGDANINPEGVIPPWPNGSIAVTGSYYLELAGNGPWSVAFTTTAPWGAYYTDGGWTPAENTDGIITFNIEVPASKDLGVAFVFGDKDPTLPVELSAFTVTMHSQTAILTWVSQSETAMHGYYLLRNTGKDLESAQVISDLIPATNNSQTQTYQYRDRDLPGPGDYCYWLQAINLDGSCSYHGPITLHYEAGEESVPDLPAVTELKSIYPNPFNPSTTISYTLSEPQEVSFMIFNQRGQLVRRYRMGNQDARRHSLVWDSKDERGNNPGSGVYFIRMQAGKDSFTKKAVMMK